MNMKKMLAGVLAFAVVLLSACGDDEKAAPKSQFNFNGDAVSLTDANLYLIYEDEDGSGHIYRDYFISDGVYNQEGSGWSMSSYTGATYLIAFEAGVPVAEEVLSKGEYPLYSSFSEAPENANVGWFSFESDAAYYETPDGIIGGDPIVLSGSFDDGDTMVVKFNGTLEYYGEGSSEEFSGKFYFKGEVQDMRSVPTLLRNASAKGGSKQ